MKLIGFEGSRGFIEGRGHILSLSYSPCKGLYISEDWGSVGPLGFPPTENRTRFGRACVRAGGAKPCERVQHNFLNASGSGIKCFSFFFFFRSANGSLLFTSVLSI